MSIIINNRRTNSESNTLDFQQKYSPSTWGDTSRWTEKSSISFMKYDSPIITELANPKTSRPYSSNILENYDIQNIIDALKSAKNTLLEEEDGILIIPVPEFVWDLAQTFLTSYAKWINNNCEILIDTPDIASLPNGSLDILWYNKKGKILINIDNSLDDKAYYYSDFHNRKNPMKGNVEINSEIDESLAIRIKKLLIDD